VILGLVGIFTYAVYANPPYNEATGIQNTNSDPSPDAVQSNVGNYINQEERINIAPTDGVVKVLRTDQKNLINDFVDAVIPIKHALPREMRNVMRQVTGQEGGRAEVIQDKVSKEFFLQVMAPRYMMPYLCEAVAALDVDWLQEYKDGSEDLYVQMLNRDAAFVDTIATCFGGDDSFTKIDTTNNAIRHYDEIFRNSEYMSGVGQVDIPANQVLLDVKMYEINGLNDLKLGLDYVAWKNGPGRQLFSFIQAGYGAGQRAKGLTSVFDPFLDARIPLPAGDTRQILDTASNENYQSANFLLTSNYVDFLQVKGKAQLINSQQLLVTSAHAATLTSSEQVMALANTDNELDTVTPNRAPIIIGRTNTGRLYGDKNGNGVKDPGEVWLDDEESNENTVQVPIPKDPTTGKPLPPNPVNVTDYARRLNYKNAGTVTTSLTVTPYVGLVSMELALNLQLNDLNGLAPNGLPIINTRNVQTTARLLDGQPFVIAGLKQIHNINSGAKAPGLGGIPVLGYLFGGESSMERKGEVVITITPHFNLASMVSVETPLQVKTADAIVKGKAPLPLPDMKLGYDQWLLGS